MRLLWINHRDPKHPQAGGAEVHIREVGKRLVERGCEVTLVSERFDGSGSEDIIDGINVRRMGNRYSLHLIAPLLVEKWAKEYDVVVDDIAHAIPWWSTLVTRKPVLGIVHHVHQLVASVELAFPLNLVVRVAEKTIKHAYKNLIAVSKATKDDLVNLLGVPGERVNVIHYGVDHKAYSPGRERFWEPTILWLGRIKKYKNLDPLVMAFSIVKRRLPNARLIIAGWGDYRGEVKELVSKLGIKDVIFTGKVWGDRKVGLLRKSWVLAMTSVVEGWGMSILEAAACGTPAVGYDAGAIKEAIVDGKTGFLIEYGDVKELANKIHLILTDEGLRSEMSKDALKYSYDFDWDKTTDQTMKAMEEVMR